MDHQQLKVIIDRYLEGKASPAEQAFIAQWLDEEPPSTADLSNQPWEQLRTDMLTNIRQGAGYEAPSFSRKEKWITRWPTLQRIAAMLVLLVGIYALFRYYRSWSVSPLNTGQIVAVAAPVKYRSVSTGKKEVQRIVLPDSSVVILNQLSSLRFPEQFSDSRQVCLETGEAFFEVRTSATHPFIVHTQQVHTTVLGTSFTVRGHAGKVNVMVKTGKVKVSTPVTAGGPARNVILAPNHGLEVDTVTYNSRGYTLPAWIATAWCAQGLVFHQNKLTEIMLALENRFGVQIRLQTPTLGQCRYTATFTAANTLTEILDALCLVHQLKYERKRNKINIYGETCN